MKTRLGVATAVVFALLGLHTTPVEAQPYKVAMSRIEGEDRYLTAAYVSAGNWPSSAKVVLAPGERFAEALAGGPVAAKANAPLLLTAGGQMPAVVRAEIDRLKVTEVIVVGGGASLTSGEEESLKAAGKSVRRIGGDDPRVTAAHAALEVGAPTKEAIVALATNWPDAVSAGALIGTKAGLPIVLTDPEDLPDVAASALRDLGVTKAYVLGGVAAISAAVDDELRGIGAQVQRLAGDDRFGTSRAVADFAFPRFTTKPVPVVFATGGNFPDALAAAPLAARLGALVVLAHPSDMNQAQPIGDTLRPKAAQISRGLVLGGGFAVSGTSDWQLRAALAGQPFPTATFGAGEFVVNGDIAPGTYRNSDSSQGCYWARLKGFSGGIDDIEGSDFTFARSIVTIDPADKGFRSSRCGTWSPDLSPLKAPSAPIEQGTFLVGSEVAPGTWRTNGGDGCYWERLKGFSGRFGDTAANGFDDAPQTVQIGASDVGFKTQRCAPWTKIG